jgi:hypothetical protein
MQEVYAGYLCASHVGERIVVDDITDDDGSWFLHRVEHRDDMPFVRLILDRKSNGGRSKHDIDPRTIVTIV